MNSSTEPTASAAPRPTDAGVPAWRATARRVLHPLGALELTVVLLALSVMLVFAATLDQVNLGLWGMQEKWIRSWVVFVPAGRFAVPIFPGGYALGSLLFANLLAAHGRHFRAEWRQAGVALTHGGLLLLLVGELLSGAWQEDYYLRLNHGETRNYAESGRFHELALIDESDSALDRIVAIADSALADAGPIRHGALPFAVLPRAYFPNSTLTAVAGAGSPATTGAGLQVLATPQPLARGDQDGNLASAYVELRAPGASLGTFLVSSGLAQSQGFEYGGRRWSIALRPRRLYGPFALKLLQFSHDRYPGTEIPRNFSSRLHLTTPDGREDREVLISMNNPLRHAGLTFYQAGFENEDRTTVLQVVRNPSWLLPYIACAMMTAGMLLQFGRHLVRFITQRRGPRPAP